MGFLRLSQTFGDFPRLLKTQKTAVSQTVQPTGAKTQTVNPLRGIEEKHTHKPAPQQNTPKNPKHQNQPHQQQTAPTPKHQQTFIPNQQFKSITPPKLEQTQCHTPKPNSPKPPPK
jgi:hypothetical protein